MCVGYFSLTRNAIEGHLLSVLRVVAVEAPISVVSGSYQCELASLENVCLVFGHISKTEVQLGIALHSILVEMYNRPRIAKGEDVLVQILQP
jgi:hypothetical protein